MISPCVDIVGLDVVLPKTVNDRELRPASGQTTSIEISTQDATTPQARAGRGTTFVVISMTNDATPQTHQ